MRFFVTLSFLLIATVAGCKPPQTQTVSTPAAVEQVPATLDEAREAKREGRKDLYEKSLQQISRGTDAVAARRALVELAMHYDAEKRHDEAAATFSAAANANQSIAPYLAVRMIDSLRRAGRPGEAITIAQQLTTNSPNSPAAAEARIRIPALHALAGNSAEANARAAELQSVPINEFTEGALVQTADDLASTGSVEAANAIRFRLLTTYTQGRHTEKLYEQLSVANNDRLSQENFTVLSELADKLARANRYDQALDLLAKLESRFPTESQSPGFQHIKLRALFHSRNYDRAALVTLPKSEPSYLAAELLRARAHWRNDQNREFRAMVEQIIRDYPQSKEAGEGRILLSKYFLTDEIDHAKSLEYLKTAIAGGAYGNEGENLWNLGWTHVLAGNDTEALAAFGDYLKRYPDADYTTNSLFWTAKVYAKRGDTAQRDRFFQRLITEYPYAYYAYRAREILGLPMRAPDQVPTGAPFPELQTAEVADAEAKMATVRELLDLGLNAEAARELAVTVGATPENPAVAYRLAELYSAAGEPLKAMGMLQRKFRDIIRHGSPNVPHRFWEILYPFSYAEEIRRGAEHSKIDPYLISAIIRQESAFNPSVVSNAGAVGLTQIMPNELPHIAQVANLPPATRADLFKPEVAAMYGAAEFRQKLTVMNGNQLLAIASYNAGEKAVSGWIGNGAIEDVDVFVDSIPYAETRLYVKNVTRNYYEYKRVYERPAAQ